MNLTIKTLTGSAIKPYLNELARLRIAIFREFPYLYDGDMEYEASYLETYLRSEEAVMVLAIHDKKVVGASSGMPLMLETNAVKKPFLEAGMEPEKIFYFGESLLELPYRGKGIGHIFFDEREKHALNPGRFETTTFCAVHRPETHPLRPPAYLPLDSFWKKRGYTPTQMTTHFQWKDVDENEESDKLMRFWIKNWKSNTDEK